LRITKNPTKEPTARIPNMPLAIADKPAVRFENFIID
jgi:hypothetical protein